MARNASAGNGVRYLAGSQSPTAYNTRTIPLTNGQRLRIVPAGTNTGTPRRHPLPLRTDPAYPSLNSFLKFRWEQQQGNDVNEQTRYAPDRTILNRENTPYGELRYRKFIHRGFDSVVLSVTDRPSLVVKYQVSHEPGSLHGLLVDAWFTEAAWSLGIAPRVFYVSPAVSCEAIRDGKFSFRSAAFIDSGIVRYMIMERANGLTLGELRDLYPNSAIPLRVAIPVIISVMKNLSKLHESSIVHGDIHSGNVMVLNGTSETQLIDFGLAFIQETGMNVSNSRQFPTPLVHPLASPWQLAGRAWGKRDDVFKTLIMMARMINDDELSVYEEKMTKSNAGLHRLIYWRLHQFIFKIPGSSTFDPFSSERLGVDSELATNVRSSFSRILQLAVSMTDVNERPPYEAIISEFENCAKLLNH